VARRALSRRTGHFRREMAHRNSRQTVPVRITDVCIRTAASLERVCCLRIACIRIPYQLIYRGIVFTIVVLYAMSLESASACRFGPPLPGILPRQVFAEFRGKRTSQRAKMPKNALCNPNRPSKIQTPHFATPIRSHTYKCLGGIGRNWKKSEQFNDQDGAILVRGRPYHTWKWPSRRAMVTRTPNRFCSRSSVSSSFLGPSATILPSRIMTMRSISGAMSAR
jgi:hypothetical protein